MDRKAIPFAFFAVALAMSAAAQTNGTNHKDGAVTGAATAQTVNGVVNAMSYSPATISAPSEAAGLQVFTAGHEGSRGGAVAAGTYACEVTYVGASGGETTPSAPSRTVVASAKSTLYCAANDAPAGAVSYNVYWQTGGSGAFHEGHTGIPFGVQDAQTKTPSTATSAPPSSNTATAAIAAAQAALAGNPGIIWVPSGMGGNAGDPAAGQSIYDHRTGSILQRMGVGAAQKSTTGSVMNYGFSQDIILPNGALAANGQQMNGIASSIQQGGIHYGYGLPPLPASVNIFARNYRFGKNPNWIWSANLLAYVENQDGGAYGAEIDCYNNSSTNATGDGGCTGISLQSNGKKVAFNAIELNGPGMWSNGLVIDSGNVLNNGILIGTGMGMGINNHSGYYATGRKVIDPSGNVTPTSETIGSSGSTYVSREKAVVRGGPICTAGANGTCSFTISWPRSFPDTNYGFNCYVAGSTGPAIIYGQRAKTAATVAANFHDLSGAPNDFTEAYCEGWD